MWLLDRDDISVTTGPIRPLLIKMSNPLAISTLTLILCISAPIAWAQRISWQIDSGHSTASLTVNSALGGSPWNIGIAKVSGMVEWDSKDVTTSVFDFTIYPARQGALLLNPDGSVRSYTSADLSRYTVMTFRSDHAEVDVRGKLQVHGVLAVTHVEREANITWSNAYSGPEYGAPVPHSTAGEVVFTIENSSSAIRLRPKISGFATLNLKDFPGLRTAMLDAIWPIVVEDEHCEVPAPKPSLRDYQGAICTGNPIEVTPISQPPERLGIDYPGPSQVTTPAADLVTIVLRVNTLNVDSETSDSTSPK
jgi:polyisoprenoid-binding protein YceI